MIAYLDGLGLGLNSSSRLTGVARLMSYCFNAFLFMAGESAGAAKTMAANKRVAKKTRMEERMVRIVESIGIQKITGKSEE